VAQAIVPKPQIVSRASWGAVEVGDPAILDRYEPERRPIAIEYINANTARNKKLMEERDPQARKRAQDEMCRIAADPVTAKAFLMKSSMLQAVRAATSG